jgi:putative ABC transport system permease protein
MNTLQLFRLISLHHIWRSKLRTLFVIFVVAIGSLSMFTAFDAIYKRDASRSYGVSLLHGRAVISIEGVEAAPILAETLQTIRTTDGVELAAPLVMDGALIIGQPTIIPLVGIDPAIEPQVRLYNIIEGTFITEPGQVLITDAFAEDFAVGDTIRLAGKGGLRSYTVAGILAQDSIAALNGGDLFFLHYSDVQDIARLDTFNFVSVVTSGNVDEQVSTLQTSLPTEMTVKSILTGQEKTSIEVVVDILGIISNGTPAVLGALMITSTMAAGVAQRRKEIAILRSLGVTQRGIQTIFIVEAAIIGFIGSVFGVIFGVLLNQGMLDAAATVGTFSATAKNAGSPIWVYSLIILTGVLMSIGAMWLPARKTASIDPTEAMRQPAVKTESARFSIVRTVIGIALLVTAVVLRFAFDNSALVPMAVITGTLFVIIGATLVFPPLMVWISQRMPFIMRRLFGFSGLMAAENLSTRHQRAMATGLTALVVIWFYLLGISFTAGTNYLVNSLANAEYNWDIIVSGPGADARTTISSIPPDVVTEIIAREGIETVVVERLAPYTYQETDFTIRAVDLETFASAGGNFAWEQGDNTAAIDRLRQHDKPAVLVGGFEALMIGLRQVSATITLPTPQGDMQFEVVGTINSPAGNTFVMDYDLYTSIWNDTQIDRLSINLTENADADGIRRSLSQQYSRDGIVVTDRDEIRALFGRQNGGAEVFVGVFLFPFMMLGIGNMLFIAVLDRQREFGMLRAIGTLRRQITWSVVLEALILVGAACIVAVPAALLSIETMLFERIVAADVRPDIFLTARSIVIILFVAGLAAYLPARRAGRLNILEALRYE